MNISESLLGITVRCIQKGFWQEKKEEHIEELQTVLSVLTEKMHAEFHITMHSFSWNGYQIHIIKRNNVPSEIRILPSCNHPYHFRDKDFSNTEIQKIMCLYTNIHRQETKYRNEITYKPKFIIPEQYKETRLLVFCLAAPGCKTKGWESILVFVHSRGKAQNTISTKPQIDTNTLYCGSSSFERHLSTQSSIFYKSRAFISSGA